MVSKAIMLNKYGLNVGPAYDEQFTLLEPNNLIPSWEAGDEEKKEVSNALRNLREKYDQIHRLVMEKERALEQLKVSGLSVPDKLSAHYIATAKCGCFRFVERREEGARGVRERVEGHRRRPVPQGVHPAAARHP